MVNVSRRAHLSRMRDPIHARAQDDGDEGRRGSGGDRGKAVEQRPAPGSVMAGK